MFKGRSKWIANVKNFIDSNGFSQRQVAIKAGLDPSSFNKILKGTNDPTLETMGKVANALGVSLPYLLASIEEKAALDQATRRVITSKEELLSRLQNVSEQDAETLLDVLPPLSSIAAKKSGT